MRSFLTPLLTGLALLFGASPASVAAEEHRAAGHVYVLNNDLVGPNSITVFARAADGLSAECRVDPLKRLLPPDQGERLEDPR